MPPAWPEVSDYVQVLRLISAGVLLRVQPRNLYYCGSSIEITATNSAPWVLAPLVSGLYLLHFATDRR